MPAFPPNRRRIGGPSAFEGVFEGVVVANELLDNLPFRLAVFDGGWQEAFVDAAPDGRLVEVLRPFAELPPCLPATASHGARAPVQAEATAWVVAAVDALARGRVVVFDYARTTAEMAARPWRDWLRTYRRHERGGHYLAEPGTQDITADVALDQLPASLSRHHPGRASSAVTGWTSSSRRAGGVGRPVPPRQTWPRSPAGAASGRPRR